MLKNKRFLKRKKEKRLSNIIIIVLIVLVAIFILNQIAKSIDKELAFEDQKTTNFLKIQK